MDVTYIHIFKTNILGESDKQKVKSILASTPGVSECSVDTEDIDKVLRVVSDSLQADEVIDIVSRVGYHCEEL